MAYVFTLNGTSDIGSSAYAPGMVGIGTPDPQAILEVTKPLNDDSSQSPTAAIRASTPDNGWLDINPNADASDWNPLVQARDTCIIFTQGSQETGNLVIGPWSASALGLRITSGGNIGIGMNNPLNLVETIGDLQYTGGTVIQSGYTVAPQPGLTFPPGVGGGVLVLADGFTTHITTLNEDGTLTVTDENEMISPQSFTIYYAGFNITSDANVGIGTWSPAATLEVNGNVQIDGYPIMSYTDLTIYSNPSGYDYAIYDPGTASVLRISINAPIDWPPSTPFIINGFTGGTAGRCLWITNVPPTSGNSYWLAIVPAPLAGEGIACRNSAGVYLGPNQSMFLWFDPVSNYWRELGDNSGDSAP